ncbi:hypothetical protein [Colwellia sp. BRX8-9]|uniref:hypothetical protein n=1 Tax=Colwellia sp. BRX8-9 TaxID=2759831 RepID=UPI0015F4F2A2|nr:hypothetical protein [Colwellia sp. BRX8-9]MBA6349649.1 hypothetical protein [Colwellia sp. BRX8-9]
MLKTVLSWVLCWSLLALSFYLQKNDMAVFVLLCVEYIPLVVILFVYIFQLGGGFNKSTPLQDKKTLWNNFKLPLLTMLVMTILLLTTLHLPQESQDERAVKLLLVFAIGMFLTAIALMSFVDTFISKKQSKDKK